MNETTTNPEPVNQQPNGPSSRDSASAQPQATPGSEQFASAGQDPNGQYPNAQYGYAQQGYAAPGYSGQPQTGTAPMQGFFDWIRRLNWVRTTDRWFGGVAGGIARKLGTGTGLVRIILFLLIVFGGLSLWFYLLAWALLPDEQTGSIPLQRLLS